MINDVWQLTVKGTVTETTHVHTLHFREGILVEDGQTLIDSWLTSCLATYRILFGPGQLPVQEVEARKVCGSTPLPGPDVTIPAAGQQGGTRDTFNSQNAPAFMAVCVTEKGESAGRRYSGRFFLGGLVENDLDANMVAPFYVGLANAYCNALKTTFIDPALPAWRLFAYSGLLAKGDQQHTSRPTTPGGPRVASPVDAVPCQMAGSPVRALVVNPRPTTMRSRKYGHGS